MTRKHIPVFGSYCHPTRWSFLALSISWYSKSRTERTWKTAIPNLEFCRLLNFPYIFLTFASFAARLSQQEQMNKNEWISSQGTYNSDSEASGFSWLSTLVLFVLLLFFLNICSTSSLHSPWCQRQRKVPSVRPSLPAPCFRNHSSPPHWLLPFSSMEASHAY